MFGQLGRIAEIGDEIEFSEAHFRVVAMDGRRVERVALLRTTDPDAEA